jgi:magnesium-transporting ATPase (P-type)
MQGMFMSQRKRAAVAFDMGDGKVRIYAKGGPDFLATYCDNLFIDEKTTVGFN